MAISLQARRRRGATRHTATVRRAGVTLSATFWQRRQAEAWSRDVEAAIDAAHLAGTPFDPAQWRRRGRDATGAEAMADLRDLDLARDPDADDRPRADWTLRRALQHYEATVTATKKGRTQETVRINAWIARPIADQGLNMITADVIQQHIDDRTAAARAAMTIRNEVLLLSAVYRLAGSPPRPGGRGGGWGLAGLANPVAAAHLPAPPAGRQRRLQDGEEASDGEEARMRAALLAGLDGQAMAAILTLAIETGMRMSEILDLRPSQVRRVRGARVVERPDSKSGHARRVVLSTRAAAALDNLIVAQADDQPIFRMRLPAVEYRWKKARAAAGVTGLTLHDLRHEALSRMAGAGLTIGELQQQSGHRTVQILLRYVNARPADVAKKLG